jgi:hypothetical protein
VNVGTNLIDLTVSWYVNNSLIQNGSSLNFTPVSLPLGQVTLKAVVSKGGYSSETTKIITVTAPYISGPSNPALNTAVTYTVPTSGLPTGVTFDGFTVTGSTDDRTFTQSGGTLNVTFITESLFTITATYTLPDDTTYNITKTINKTPPPPPSLLVPILSSQSLSNGQVRVYVNNVQTDTQYEWQKGNLYVLSLDGFPPITEIIVDPPAPPASNLPISGLSYIEVKCRAKLNGETSAWSQAIRIYPDVP